MGSTSARSRSIVGVLREHEIGARTDEEYRRVRDLERDLLQVESDMARHTCRSTV
jgi:hypothetical protein